jgi:hypothetical protein
MNVAVQAASIACRVPEKNTLQNNLLDKCRKENENYLFSECHKRVVCRVSEKTSAKTSL